MRWFVSFGHLLVIVPDAIEAAKWAETVSHHRRQRWGIQKRKGCGPGPGARSAGEVSTSQDVTSAMPCYPACHGYALRNRHRAVGRASG